MYSLECQNADTAHLVELRPESFGLLDIWFTLGQSLSTEQHEHSCWVLFLANQWSPIFYLLPSGFGLQCGSFLKRSFLLLTIRWRLILRSECIEMIWLIPSEPCTHEFMVSNLFFSDVHVVSDGPSRVKHTKPDCTWLHPLSFLLVLVMTKTVESQTSRQQCAIYPTDYGYTICQPTWKLLKRYNFTTAPLFLLLSASVGQMRCFPLSLGRQDTAKSFCICYPSSFYQSLCHCKGDLKTSLILKGIFSRNTFIHKHTV